MGSGNSTYYGYDKKRPELTYYRLVDLITYKDKINLDIKPIHSNYVVEDGCYVVEIYPGFHPSESKLNRHVRIINPDEDCFLGFTQEQCDNMYINKNK